MNFSSCSDYIDMAIMAFHALLLGNLIVFYDFYLNLLLQIPLFSKCLSCIGNGQHLFWSLFGFFSFNKLALL